MKGFMGKFKSITADTQVTDKPCWLLYASLYHDGKTTLVIYDEADNSASAAQKFDTLAVDDTNGDPTDRISLSRPIFMRKGIFVKWAAGVGTVVWEPY